MRPLNILGLVLKVIAAVLLAYFLPRVQIYAGTGGFEQAKNCIRNTEIKLN